MVYLCIISDVYTLHTIYLKYTDTALYSIFNIYHTYTFIDIFDILHYHIHVISDILYL